MLRNRSKGSDQTQEKLLQVPGTEMWKFHAPWFSLPITPQFEYMYSAWIISAAIFRLTVIAKCNLILPVHQALSVYIYALFLNAFSSNVKSLHFISVAYEKRINFDFLWCIQGELQNFSHILLRSPIAIHVQGLNIT